MSKEFLDCSHLMERETSESQKVQFKNPMSQKGGDIGNVFFGFNFLCFWLAQLLKQNKQMFKTDSFLCFLINKIWASAWGTIADKECYYDIKFGLLGWRSSKKLQNNILQFDALQVLNQLQGKEWNNAAVFVWEACSFQWSQKNGLIFFTDIFCFHVARCMLSCRSWKRKKKASLSKNNVWYLCPIGNSKLFPKQLNSVRGVIRQTEMTSSIFGPGPEIWLCHSVRLIYKNNCHHWWRLRHFIV